MSEPLSARHIIDPRLGSTYVSARFAQMHCDRQGCKNTVARAPKLVVHPRPWIIGLSPKPITAFTTLHYCELHKGDITAEDLLTAIGKGRIEHRAKQLNWSLEFKPDFDTAFIEWCLVTTPEYRKFLTGLELNVAAHRDKIIL